MSPSNLVAVFHTHLLPSELLHKSASGMGGGSSNSPAPCRATNAVLLTSFASCHS